MSRGASAASRRGSSSLRWCSCSRPLELLERGEVRVRRGRVLNARLPEGIAERERAVLLKEAGWAPDSVAIDDVESVGPGNAVLIEAGFDALTEVLSYFGEYGVRAEAIADHVVKDYRHWLAAGVPVGRHLADQLMLPMALGRGGAYRTVAHSSHSATNRDLLRDFDFVLEDGPADGKTVRVNIRGTR